MLACNKRNNNSARRLKRCTRPEHTVEPLRRCKGDEKLAAVRIWPGIGHRHDTGTGMFQFFVNLISKLRSIDRSAPSACALMANIGIMILQSIWRRLHLQSDGISKVARDGYIAIGIIVTGHYTANQLIILLFTRKVSRNSYVFFKCQLHYSIGYVLRLLQ